MTIAKFKIISDGSCDLPDPLLRKKGIDIIPFYLSFDGNEYDKEERGGGVRDFYRRMVENPGVYPKTSMPSVEDYSQAFCSYARTGIPVVCICITAKFSGSVQAAMTARGLVKEMYSEAEIEVIDGAVSTVLMGLYVLEAARIRDDGVPLGEAVKILERIRETGRIFFTVGSLDYLRNGGRIGKLQGIAATVLDLKPLITLREGEMFPSGVARGRKKSMDKVIGLLIEYLEERNADLNEYRLTVGYGYDYEEAVRFAEHTKLVLESHGFPVRGIPVNQIGASIAVHTGPYSIGFGIMKRYR